MGVASLVLGIIAILLSFIPVLGLPGAIILGILAVIFGALGRRDKAQKTMATSGLVLAIVALVIAFSLNVLFFGAVSELDEEAGSAEPVETVAQSDSPSQPESNTAWSAGDVKTDPITDQRSVILRTKATSVSRIGFLADSGIYDDPALIIRCNQDAENDVYVYWGGQSFIAVLDSTEGFVRWGSDKAIPTEWSASTDYEATFHPNPQGFIDHALKHQNVAIRVSLDDQEATGEFITFGLNAHLNDYPECR